MQNEDYYKKQRIFVDLRAQGRTLHRIGEILGIRPAALARWERRCAHSIADTKAFLALQEPDDEEQLNCALTHPRERLNGERNALRAWLEFEYRLRMVEIIAICLVRARRAATESHMQVLSMLEPGLNRRQLRETSAADFAQLLARLSQVALVTRRPTPARLARRNQNTPTIANN